MKIRLLRSKSFIVTYLTNAGIGCLSIRRSALIDVAITARDDKRKETKGFDGGPRKGADGASLVPPKGGALPWHTSLFRSGDVGGARVFQIKAP